MRVVLLLHNQYRIPHVSVQEVDPKVGVHLCPPLADSIGQLMYPAAIGKETLYRLGFGVVGGVFH